MAILRTLLAFVIAAQASAPAGFKADWSVVLRAESVTAFNAKYSGWCDGNRPALTGYWAPEADQIRATEAALAPALEQALIKKIPDESKRPNVQDYYRQYIGITDAGRRVVFVNGFHRRQVEIGELIKPPRPSRWRTDVVMVCDGGAWFFGAEYDPATRKIGPIEFNSTTEQILSEQATAPAFKPEWGVVLPESGTTLRGAKIQRWCSRSGPALSGYWKPDADQIRVVETALAPVLEQALAKIRAKDSKKPAVEDYYRQYIGITIRGERVIFVNGLYQSVVNTDERQPQRWMSQVVFVCDGGHAFFGAEYDMTKKVVRNLAFNGPGAP